MTRGDGLSMNAGPSSGTTPASTKPSHSGFNVATRLSSSRTRPSRGAYSKRTSHRAIGGIR